jgi:hypothetical protein
MFSESSLGKRGGQFYFLHYEHQHKMLGFPLPSPLNTGGGYFLYNEPVLVSVLGYIIGTK